MNNLEIEEKFYPKLFLLLWKYSYLTSQKIDKSNPSKNSNLKNYRIISNKSYNQKLVILNCNFPP